MAVEIFFCYAHEDAHLLNDLTTHLQSLERQERVKLWHDHDISPGSEWKRDIEQHLNSAQIILLLISPDFMASEHCWIEMNQALERHKRSEARVIPILLRPINWESVPFGHLQVLPSKKQSITTSENHDEAFVEVVTGILKVVKELTESSKMSDVSANPKSTPFRTPLNIAPSMRKKTMEQWIKEANTYEKAQNWLKALFAYEQIIQIDPDNAIIFYKKGKILKELERYEEALVAYRQVMQLDPLNIGVYKKVGDVLRKLKRPEEALVAYEWFIQQTPGDRNDHFYSSEEAEVWMYKGSILFDLKRYKEAIASCDKAFEMSHYDFEYMCDKAYMLAECELYEEALIAYDEAIKGKFAYAFLGKANVLYNTKRYDESLIAYNDAIECVHEFYDSVRIHINMGNILFELKRDEEALASYENALVIHRREREAIYEQDSIYASNSISDDRTNDLVNLYTGKGNVLQSLGKFEEAQQSYMQANRLTSNNS